MCRRCRLSPALIPDKQGDSHARQDGEHRPADDRERPAQHPAGNGDAQAQQQPGPSLVPVLHVILPLFRMGSPIIP